MKHNIQEQIEIRDTNIYLYIGIDDFNINNVSFMELVNNRVYSDSCVVINGIFIKFNNLIIKSYLIKWLISFEEHIIELYKQNFDCSRKKASYIIKDYFTDIDNTNFFNNAQTLKLSGVWETKTNFGLNHKFIRTINTV
jgi:hypothetical protein